MNGAVLQTKIIFKSRLRHRFDDRQSALNRRFEMTHDAKLVEQKAASDGCCGGKSKDNTAAPAVARPDAKPADDSKHADHIKTGGSCC